jgi:hypothetical protein
MLRMDVMVDSSINLRRCLFLTVLLIGSMINCVGKIVLERLVTTTLLIEVNHTFDTRKNNQEAFRDLVVLVSLFKEVKQDDLFGGKSIVIVGQLDRFLGSVLRFGQFYKGVMD